MRINEQIRAREVRVVDEAGEQLGIFSTRDAINLAYERNLDLVEVAPTARPAVCRIMDYGRFKYDQSKRDKEARKKQRLVEIKEVKMRPRIDAHDFGVKARAADRFLREGNKVKATIMFRGREVVHAELGRLVLDRLTAYVQDAGQVERPPRLEGRNMVMFFTPRPQARTQIAAEEEGAVQRAQDENA
ncbi:MAG: translation initiation factor IF-3 [bacterium]|nr:translation initiation factor IF-3 [bacterium]